MHTKRVSNRRSKQGCVTCRTRRIKCDEVQPQCLRCTKAGLKCSYAAGVPVTAKAQGTYGSTSNTKGNSNRPLLPKQGISSLTTVRPASILPGETAVENHYLRYFQHETSSGFQGAWDWSIWNRLMLQGCHQEAFIRETVVAIGALHKALRTSSTLGPGAQNTDELVKLQRQFAYQKYGRALKRIQHAIYTSSDPQDALIACLLITCFEAHSGDRYKSLYHAQHGLRIYHQIKDGSSALDDDIADAFRNLDIQISTVSDERTPEMHEKLLDKKALIVNTMPTVFTNLDEAKRYWLAIMQRFIHFIPTTWKHTDPASLVREFKIQWPGSHTTVVGTNTHTTSYKVNDEVKAEQSKYHTEMCQYLRAFEPVFQRIRKNTSSTLRQYVAATIFKIHAINSKIALAGIVYTSEMLYDTHISDFKTIINLANDVVKVRNSGSPTNYFSGLFGFDLGIIVPLFHLLLKCRDHDLRCQGIELLKGWHAEGWWEPLLIIAICKCAIEIEEEGMVDGVIPEESRVILTAKCHKPPADKMLLQFVQRTEQGLRWIERWVEWESKW